MFKGVKKDDLRLIATELNIAVGDKATIADLIHNIENSDIYKNKLDFVQDIAHTIIENRKLEEQRLIDIEKLKLERSKNELELAKIRNETKSQISESDLKCESLDQMIKSIRTLTVKVPIRPEGWNYFFSSLERAFNTKLVPESYKPEILLNLLGERASNVITYLSDNDISNYEKIKTIVLREFEPTPQACLDNFKKARRLNESHVQFVSRLSTNFEYYLKLRKVSDFETLKQLIISDKLFECLDRETAAHISIRQADSWFAPQKLASEADLYISSRGNSPFESGNNIHKNRDKFKNRNSVSKVFFSDIKQRVCVLCNKNHGLFKCPDYLNLSVNERVDLVKQYKLCFNCLQGNCLASNCKSKELCHCGLSHHRSLHFPKQRYGATRNIPDKNKREKQVLSSDSQIVEPSINNTNSQIGNTSGLNDLAPEFIPQNSFTFMSHSNKNKTVLLSTIICYLSDENGKRFKIRALLDVGSEINILSRNCVELLNLKKEKTNVAVSGLNDSSLSVKWRTNASISNQDESYVRKLTFLVVPKITADYTPSRKINVSIQDFSDIKLADEKFYIPERVDMLLGAEIFYELLRPGQIRVSDSNFILQNTVFGYVVSGGISEMSEQGAYCGIINKDNNLDKTLNRFWEIENIELEIPKNKESVICDKHFKENYSRDGNGRYIVKMPLKNDPCSLGSSKQIAIKKLNGLWNRLVKDPEYSKLYSDFLKEYERLGHMVQVSESEEKVGSYYIPHLGVYRGIERSKSTPLRVVFNASSLTTKGNSLNSIQYNGGVIQDDLFSIMLRFRKHIFAFTADIQKMYRAILIHPSQRELQKILWKEGPCEPIKTFELTTVTYGTVSAPNLSIQTLHQLSNDEGSKYPLAATVLKEDFYMDDVLTGAASLPAAIELQQQLKNLLESGGMYLHKWCSNTPEICKSTQDSYPFNESEESKTLGVMWKAKKDCFSFNVEIINEDNITKRKVLSIIARIFDPLGIIGPVITIAKTFLQKLWLLKLSWNDFLPEKESKEWKQFSDTLPFLNDIEINRCILIPNAVQIEFHGFCDACETAYGAAVYCKSVSKDGQILVRLIASKSRVSPIKQVSIPRLELCGAVLLAKLMKRVNSAIKISVCDQVLWCDSMIVLSWLRKEPFQLKTFVGNRISTIQQLTEAMQWRHVSSQDNPADVLCRGFSADKLHLCELWWNGPKFLKDKVYPAKNIPGTFYSSEYSSEFKSSNDCKKNLLTLTPNSLFDDLLNISNSFTKIVRVLSFIFRFLDNMKGKKLSGPLGVKEIQNAQMYLCKFVQKQEFKKEICDLTKNGKVSSDSKIKQLLPFIDQKGVLRVGGRLINSQYNYDKKFPVILPKNHKLTMLIIESYHKKFLHIGPQGLLNSVRQEFWPVNGRNMCRKVTHNCVICFKAKPLTCDQLMGSLPKERVTVNYPFSYVGVDFCGHFFIKYPNQRKGNCRKIYVCIFVCFVTKCVHLDIVTDLTSNAFIATLKRFIARRGKCVCLFSDNARNFVGCNRELQKLYKLVTHPDDILAKYLTNENIDWRFIPPRSPNFAGLWEAGVKSFKYHLKRVVSDSKLTYEEFLTVVAQVESILNSRPISPLSSDDDNFEALTPGHFLVGRPLTSIPEPTLIDISDNRLNRWQRLTKFVQCIWKRWYRDYLSTLQQRGKWQFYKNNVEIGSLVLIKEDNLPQNKWILGRIVKVHPGADNKVRVVEVRTSTGILKRGITKIAILPVA